MLTIDNLEKRRLGIGGSDVGAIAGLSKWKTPLDVYLEKIGENVGSVDNRFTHWGNIHESSIANEYASITGEVLKLSPETIINADNNFMIANVDALTLSGKIVELKTASAFSANQWGEPGTDNIPDNYLLQIAHYCLVCNIEYADLAVLIDNSDFRIYNYKRNRSLESKILEIEENFWNNHVIQRIPPKPVSLDDCKLLWARSIHDCKIATEMTAKICYELSSIKSQIHDLQKREDELKKEIQIEMGNHDTLTDSTGDVIATWKVQTRKSFFVKESESRVFRLSKNYYQQQPEN